jgi:hypothetical protein
MGLPASLPTEPLSGLAPKCVNRLSAAVSSVEPSAGRVVRTSSTKLVPSLTSLVQQEIDSADAARKLALRHIQQAVHRYGVVVEGLWPSLARVSAASLDELVTAVEESVLTASPLFVEDERIVARFQLDVLVAISVMNSSLDELTFWAFRAINGARRVEALADRGGETRQLGELARVRTKRAWSDWSASDIAAEVAPWTPSSR